MIKHEKTKLFLICLAAIALLAGCAAKNGRTAGKSTTAASFVPNAYITSVAEDGSVITVPAFVNEEGQTVPLETSVDSKGNTVYIPVTSALPQTSIAPDGSVVVLPPSSGATEGASGSNASSGASGITTTRGGPNYVTVPTLNELITAGPTTAASTAPTTTATTLPSRPAPVNMGIYSGTRDPWLWPFAQSSIWNMPIGSNAVYVPAGLQAPKSGINVDYERHIKTTSSDPYKPLILPSAWDARWPGTGLQLASIPFPDDYIIPDARPGYTPNECDSILFPDGHTLTQISSVCRPYAGSYLVGYIVDNNSKYGDYCRYIDIRTDNGIYGTHWGSGLSAFGGSIRKGELTGSDPIRHAIKLNIYAKKYCYFNKSTNKGYRWPADRHDGYANDPNSSIRYGGTNPALAMGSLLAIWPGYTDPSQLGITTEVGKKLFYALRNYGAYVSDDTAWDHYDLCAEYGVTDDVQAKYGFSMGTSSGPYYNDMVKLINNLFIIDNNSPSSIGGGGTPLAPLAPAFQ